MMTPSAHKNSIIKKITANTSTTPTNSHPSPDHSKSLDATHAPSAKDPNTSVQKLKQKTINFAKTPTKIDQTMHLFEDHPDDDDTDSGTESFTKPNSYNTDMRDHMIKHTIKIKFVKDRYTTPMIVEFSSPLKSGKNTINITSIHCKIFAAMKILDPSLNIITQTGKIYEHPKEFPTGNEYNFFPNTTEELDRFKSKIFSRHKIEFALKLNQFKYGDETIVSTLRDSWVWIRSDRFDTHREVSIGWIKNMSPITTLHNTARSKVETALLDVTLTPAEVVQFTRTPVILSDENETTKYDNNNNKNRGATQAMRHQLMILI